MGTQLLIKKVMPTLTVILPGSANGHFRLELFSIANMFYNLSLKLRETVLKEVTTMWGVPRGYYPLLTLTLMRLQRAMWCLLKGSGQKNGFI